MKKTVYMLSILALAYLGYTLSQVFFDYSFEMLIKDGIQFESLNASGLLRRRLVLPIVLVLLPCLYWLLEKTTDIGFIFKGLLSAVIMVLLGFVFWRLRIFGLNSEFERLSEYRLPKGTKPLIELDYLKFEIYLLMGFIVGTLICILIFRDKSKTLLN